jgi:uncharacterized membrane protein YgcG
MSDGAAGHSVEVAERKAEATSTSAPHADTGALSLLSRLWALLCRVPRQVLADGYAYYWITCALTAVALFFVHLSVEPTSSEHETLLSLLNDRREPFRGEQYPTLAALVVPGQTNDALCGSGEALAKLADDFNEAYKKPPGPLPSLVMRMPDGAGRHGRTAALAYWTVATRPPTSSPRDGGAGSGGSGRSGGSGVGSSGSGAGSADSDPWFDDAKATSTVRIPHTILPSASGPHAEQLKSEVARAAALDSFWNDRKSRFGNSDRLTAMYFVSLDGALRYAPHWESNGVAGYHLFNSASYVYSTLQAYEARTFSCGSRDHGWIETKPYLDLLGAGQTVTFCSPVSLENEIDGVLCVDFKSGSKDSSVDIDHLNTLFDVTYAKVQRDSQNAPQMQMCGEPGYESCGRPELELGDRARQALREQVKRYASRYPDDWDTRDHDQILVLDPDDGDYALWLPMPMASTLTGSSQTADAPRMLLMHLRQGDYRGFLYIFLAILMLVVVGGLVVFRVRERQRRENVQIMFDLPTGVLHEDPAGFIVDANDRAEEVLNEKLPRSGFDPSRASPRKFERLFTRFVSERFTELDYKDDIVPLRENGGTSTYYALTHGNTWVRITGSPLLRADDKTEHFGVVEPAPHAALQELARFSTRSQSS